MSKENNQPKRISHLPDVSARICERTAVLSQLIHILENSVSSHPRQAIHAKKHGNGFQYYLRVDGKESYAACSQLDLVQSVIQAEYEQKTFLSARRELDLLQKYMMLFSDRSVEQVYDRLSDGKKAMVHPVIPTDQEYLDAWDKMNYERKPFPDGAIEHRTMKGERVRSKSEELIANALFSEGIPYHYEMPLSLGNAVIHPDFTVLDIRTRKIMYWEHLGMMDEKEYARSAVRRLRDYAASGIFPGDKLILTFESVQFPLTTAEVCRVIQQYLKAPQKG